MKKKLMIIPFFLLWILYFMFTMNARTRFMAGKAKGIHCYKMDTYMNSTVYHYLPGVPPEREYVTWKEFWKQKGY